MFLQKWYNYSRKNQQFKILNMLAYLYVKQTVHTMIYQLIIVIANSFNKGL